MCVALCDYVKNSTHEISIKKGDMLVLLNSNNKYLWTVEINGIQGFVPPEYVKKLDSKPSTLATNEHLLDEFTVAKRQQKIETQYRNLVEQYNDRLNKLQESCAYHATYHLIREASDLTLWLNDKEKVVIETNLGQRPVEVLVLTSRFDDFKKEIKIKESRVHELNVIAGRLRGIIKFDASIKIQSGIDELNNKWNELQKIILERQEKFIDAHEVQLFLHDAGELQDLVTGKNAQIEANIAIGNDLTSVKRLQRKHKGFEIDLTALGECISELDDAEDATEDAEEDEEEDLLPYYKGQPLFVYHKLKIFILILHFFQLINFK